MFVLSIYPILHLFNFFGWNREAVKSGAIVDLSEFLEHLGSTSHMFFCGFHWEVFLIVFC